MGWCVWQGDGRDKRRRQTPMALVLAPTRELASQIYDEAKKVIRRGLNLASFAIHVSLYQLLGYFGKMVAADSLPLLASRM